MIRQPAWPLLVLPMVAVLLPTIGVLWFMARAMENERAAIHEKLRISYERRLSDVSREFLASWSVRRERLAHAGEMPGFQSFLALAREGICDAAVFGQIPQPPNYPWDTLAPGPGPPQGSEWTTAAALEAAPGRAEEAAARYEALARQTDQVDALFYALAGKARCLATLGRTDEALAVLSEGLLLADPFLTVRDEGGRLPALNAHLRAIELLAAAGDHDGKEAAARALAARLVNPDLVLPSSQRRFLLRSLTAHVKDPALERLLAAEDLAAAYRAAAPDAAPDAPHDGGLRRSVLPGVWQSEFPWGVALLRETTLADSGADLAQPVFRGEDAEVRPVPLDTGTGPDEMRIAAGLSDVLPGWTWSVRFADPNPFTHAADRRILAYAWIAGLVIAMVVLVALLAGWLMLRQVRLARLKNELMAVVSHELKTPLASMRALVETLIEGRCPDPSHHREYLELIARENARLSHLIDNFLTFSRMERGRRVLVFESVRPEAVVQEAAAVVRERFVSPACRFTVELAPDLPSLRGDHDALVTVLLNLLDNAHKYTGAEKRIALCAYRDGPFLCLAVEDNGIGLTRRAAARVFDRFYQVDRTLARKTGGCGLGLSIVRFIVESHGGSVAVRSAPGRGSTFVVRLPANGVPVPDPDPEQEALHGT